MKNKILNNSLLNYSALFILNQKSNLLRNMIVFALLIISLAIIGIERIFSAMLSPFKRRYASENMLSRKAYV
jgi:hypothetical protein